MAWLNAQGQPVATGPQVWQFDVPTEASADAPVCQAAANDFVAVVKTGDIAAIVSKAWSMALTLSGFNFITVVLALMQLFAALKSGDGQAIANAIQALINAFLGK